MGHKLKQLSVPPTVISHRVVAKIKLGNCLFKREGNPYSTCAVVDILRTCNLIAVISAVVLH